jgi:hypothetical protein
VKSDFYLQLSSTLTPTHTEFEYIPPFSCSHDLNQLQPASQRSSGMLSTDSDPSLPEMNLTFGLELEFSLAVLPLSFPDPHPNHTRSVYAPIRDPSLPIDAPASSDIWHDDCTPDNPMFTEYKRNWMANAKSHIAAFLKSRGFDTMVTGNWNTPLPGTMSLKRQFDKKVWLIGEDHSITDGEYNGYYLLGMELNSPPLRFNQSSLRKVRKVLELLSKEYMILCDKTSSIHVHIGNSGKSFSFDTVKNFALLAYTFEPQLSQIHPQRYTGGKCIPYSPPLRTGSTLVWRLCDLETENQLWEAGKSYSHETAALDMLYSTSDILELAVLFNGPGCERSACYLGNLYEGWANGRDQFKKTIEFRQHRSHFDGEEVAHWITVCAGLLRCAEECDTDLLLNKCKELVVAKDGNEPSLNWALSFIGCQQQGEWYRKMLKRVKENKEELEMDVTYGPINDQDDYPLAECELQDSLIKGDCVEGGIFSQPRT